MYLFVMECKIKWANHAACMIYKKLQRWWWCWYIVTIQHYISQWWPWYGGIWFTCHKFWPPPPPQYPGAATDVSHPKHRAYCLWGVQRVFFSLNHYYILSRYFICVKFVWLHLPHLLVFKWRCQNETAMRYSANSFFNLGSLLYLLQYCF